jgi:hypothetical protein
MWLFWDLYPGRVSRDRGEGGSEESVGCRTALRSHSRSRGGSHGRCLALTTSSNLAGADGRGLRQRVETSDEACEEAERGEIVVKDIEAREVAQL